MRNEKEIWSNILKNYFDKLAALVGDIGVILNSLKQRELSNSEFQRSIEEKKKKSSKDLSLQNTEYQAEDTPIDLLIKTLDLYRRFLGKQTQALELHCNKHFAILMFLMVQQMDEVHQVLQETEAQNKQISDNFELVEQTLRRLINHIHNSCDFFVKVLSDFISIRYLLQLATMFPFGRDPDNVKECPSKLIKDPDVRYLSSF